VLTFDSRSSGFKQIPRSHQLSPQRISVVGTIGSGKTTFARKTSRLLSAPHIELDALHWEPNWVEAPNDLFRERVKQSLQGDSWVVDGNYHQVRDIVWSRSDTVVWLDYPFRTIIARLARRTLRRILTNERLWNGNQEHLRGLFTRDSVFMWAIRTYRRRRRQYPILLSRPENLHLKVVRLRSPREATEFLSTLRQLEDLN
jgi:adenylate kinase family enzyme